MILSVTTSIYFFKFTEKRDLPTRESDKKIDDSKTKRRNFKYFQRDPRHHKYRRDVTTITLLMYLNSSKLKYMCLQCCSKSCTLTWWLWSLRHGRFSKNSMTRSYHDWHTKKSPPVLARVFFFYRRFWCLGSQYNSRIRFFFNDRSRRWLTKIERSFRKFLEDLLISLKKKETDDTIF